MRCDQANNDDPYEMLLYQTNSDDPDEMPHYEV